MSSCFLLVVVDIYLFLHFCLLKAYGGNVGHGIKALSSCRLSSLVQIFLSTFPDWYRVMVPFLGNSFCLGNKNLGVWFGGLAFLLFLGPVIIFIISSLVLASFMSARN